MRTTSILLAGSALLAAGCAKPGPQPVRLVLISPHRDEIRLEVAAAFPEWFHARTHAQADSARLALRAWNDHPGTERQQAVDRSFQALLADWRADEIAALHDAHQQWKQRPTPANGLTLLAALETWQPPPVELVWQDVGGGTSQISRYLLARYEVSPDSIDLDLLFGGGTEIYLRFAGRDLLQAVAMPADVLKRIPPQLNGVPLYDAKGRWYGPMLTSFGILSNREVLRRIGAPEPANWEDLGRPGLYGWVAAGDPRLSGSVHMVYEIMLQALGWDEGFRLLLRLGANVHSFLRDSGTLTRIVLSGEVAAAGNLDANALGAVARDPERMAFHLPAGRTILNPDAVAVLKGAPHTELARAFVEFLLSDAGQALLLLRPEQPGGPRRYALGRLGVVPALYDRYAPADRAVGDANPFTVPSAMTYNNRQSDDRWEALNDLLGAVILDAHPNLSAAWGAVLRLPASEWRDQLEKELFQPPVTEAELAEHARRIGQDSPRVRTETVNRWGEQAREHYRTIRRRASV